MLKPSYLLALIALPLLSFSQDQPDPVQCLPCLIGLTESHPAVQGLIEKYKMKPSEKGYSMKDNSNWAFNFLHYDNNLIIEAGIKLKNASNKMLSDFEISSSMIEFKEMHPEVMKKKFPKEVITDVFEDMNMVLTAVKFDWKIFDKPCQVTLLIGNYDKKKDQDKFIHAVSIAGKDQYYHIPLCKKFNKTF